MTVAIPWLVYQILTVIDGKQTQYDYSHNSPFFIAALLPVTVILGAEMGRSILKSNQITIQSLLTTLKRFPLFALVILTIVMGGLSMDVFIVAGLYWIGAAILTALAAWPARKLFNGPLGE